MRYANDADNQVLERVLHFNYLGCDLIYKDNKDTDIKINRFQRICIIISRHYEEGQKIKFYKVIQGRPIYCMVQNTEYQDMKI